MTQAAPSFQSYGRPNVQFGFSRVLDLADLRSMHPAEPTLLAAAPS
ncbi:MAG: hypothetical protein R3B70_15260 [Polyangiaceae bacterium]